jgi:archaellum component FlaC
MPAEIESLVLEHLRRIREGQEALRSDMREGFSELKHRLTALEQNVGNLQVQMGQTGVLMAGLNKRVDRVDDRRDSAELQFGRVTEKLDSIELRLVRIEGRVDRIDERVERIERKLDLVNA